MLPKAHKTHNSERPLLKIFQDESQKARANSRNVGLERMERICGKFAPFRIGKNGKNLRQIRAISDLSGFAANSHDFKCQSVCGKKCTILYSSKFAAHSRDFGFEQNAANSRDFRFEQISDASAIAVNLHELKFNG